VITQKELKKILHYNPNTGVFIRVRNGNIAGGINQRGYSVIMVGGTQYPAHRLAWLYVYGSFKNKDIDHINGVRLDNRIINLRKVYHFEICKNRRKNIKNTSGITGVGFIKNRDRWSAIINICGKRIKLGSFVNKFDAISARKSAENKYGYN